MKIVRRGVALGLACAALWLLVVGAGAGAWAGAAKTLGESGAFVTAALRAELGDPGEAEPPFLVRLAAEGSALFSANLSPAPSSRPAQVTPPPQLLPDAQPVPDQDDVTEDPGSQREPANIVEQTLVPSKSQGYVTGAGLYLYNRTGKDVDLKKALKEELGFTLENADAGPQILIFHTHTTEAYTPQGADDLYTESDYSRTTDENFNMIRVGDEMERVFTEMGLSVLHDRTLYDYPKYNGAYGRARTGVEALLEQYPTIQVVIDVHRDGLMDDKGTVYKPVTLVDGVKTAQVMLVLGSDDAGGDHPNWRENLALAARIQKNMDALYPTLARPMILRKSDYNQNLSPGAFLVEVGSHGNSLQEALAGARCFARSAGGVLLSLMAEE